MAGHQDGNQDEQGQGGNASQGKATRRLDHSSIGDGGMRVSDNGGDISHV